MQQLRAGRLPARIGVLAAALVINGLGGALYIGSQFGAGPRDGLMTGCICAPAGASA